MLTQGLSPTHGLRKTLAAAILLVLGLHGPLVAQGTQESHPAAGSPTLARVLAAWKARQERIKSFYFVWNLRIALHKGFEFPNGRGLAGVRRWDVAVEKDIEFTVPQLEWSGDGLDRLRSDFSEFVFSGEDGWKETGRFRITKNGSLNSRLQVPTDSAKVPTIAIWRKVAIKNPSNWSSSGDFLLDDLEIDLAPLRLAVQPLSPASDWSPDNCRVLSEDALVGNAHCIKLQMDKVGHSEQCWVDPNRDYSVVRWERRQGQAAPHNVSIDIEQGPDREWLPARWSWHLSAEPAGRAASFEATVTRRMVNKKLPATTFAADYPTGTRVYDASVDLPIVDSDDQSGMLPLDEARATLNAVADAWLQRQAKVKRFKYSWRRDGERKTVNTFCVDGDKCMTEFKTPDREPSASPSPPPAKRKRAGFREGWPIHQSKTVFDGATTRNLAFSSNPQRSGGVLDIQTGYKDFHFGMPGDRYLMLIFRPFDEHSENFQGAELRDPAKFRVRREKGKIGNVACVVIETERHPGMEMSYWLDPTRDYIPLREHRTLNGEDRERLDISYKADPTCAWAPDGWTITNVGMGGKLFYPITDTITEFSVNQPIPASDFQIEAPPGAKVQDERIDRRSAREKARDKARDAREAKQKAIFAAREAKEKAHPKLKPKPVYDPFADAAADVEAAFKLARETNKRVLIEFGANWCPGCRDLGIVLKENAEVSAALKGGFVLVLVDTDTESGRQLQEKYVPKRQRNSVPHLAVLDPSGKVLRNDDTTALEVDDDYSFTKLKAFLAEWSPPK